MMKHPQPAPFVRRWVATVIDMIVCIVIFFAWGALFRVGVGVLTGQDISQLLSHSTGHTYNNPTLFFAFLPATVSIWYYHARMEASPKMATFGKSIVGLHVVTTKGLKMSVTHATWRFCAKLILAVLSVFLVGPLIGVGAMLPDPVRPPYIVFASLIYTAFFPVALTRTKRPLHDVFSGSLIVANKP